MGKSVFAVLQPYWDVCTVRVVRHGSVPVCSGRQAQDHEKLFALRSDASREISGVCTCEVLHCTGEVEHDTCQHLRLALNTDLYMDEIRKTLLTPVVEDGSTRHDKNICYFGRSVPYAQSDKLCPVVDLSRPLKKKKKEGQGNLGTAASPRTMKEKSTWYFYSAFDAVQKIFVPVIWEQRRGFTCFMCRKSNSGVGCSHEAACRSAGRLFRTQMTEIAGEYHEADDIDYDAEDKGNENLLAMVDEHILDLRDDVSDSDSDDEEDEQGMAEIGNNYASFNRDSFENGEYCTNMVRRAHVLCTAEVEKTRLFVDRILALGPGERLRLRDRGVSTCQSNRYDEVRSETSR